MNNNIEHVELDRSSFASYYSKDQKLGNYIAYIRGWRCKTEEDYFREFSAAFQFPWYFGENWNALDECACDLDWLSFAQLTIAIDDFTAMFQGNKNLQALVMKYLEIMVDYWLGEQVSIRVILNN